MKRLITTTFIAVLLIIGTASVFAQTSDYQIKNNFEERYAELKNSIEEAMTVNRIDSLKGEIEDFEYYNEDHEKLLNNTLILLRVVLPNFTKGPELQSINY